MTKDIVASIPRINCEGCVKNVKRALQTLSGVEVIAADTSTKIVHLRYLPGQIDVETIKEALTTANYPIADIQPVSTTEREEASS